MRLVVGLSCLSCNGAGRDHMRLRRVEAEVETLERSLQNDLRKFARGWVCFYHRRISRGPLLSLELSVRAEQRAAEFHVPAGESGP